MTDITFRSDLPVRCIAHMGDDLMIARAAWGNHERLPTNGAPLSRLLGALMRDRHGSPFEFGSLVIHVEAPLFTVQQMLRHRIGFSYAQESARYRRMRPEFYCPPDERGLINTGTKMRPVFERRPGSVRDGELLRAMQRTYTEAWWQYQHQLHAGVAEEIARSVLPVATYTGLTVQLNPRSIMAFLSLRIDDPANHYDTRPQWEIEQVARQIEAIFAQHWPVTHAAFVEHGRVAP